MLCCLRLIGTECADDMKMAVESRLADFLGLDNERTRAVYVRIGSRGIKGNDLDEVRRSVVVGERKGQVPAEQVGMNAFVAFAF